MCDKNIRRLVRQALPPEAFRPNSMRVTLALPLVAGILALSASLATASVRGCPSLLEAIVLGNLYASLFFFGHEIGHGGILRSRTPSTIFMHIAFAIFCLSPHLWRIWHNDVHHGHTNDPEYDPDNFGDLTAYFHYPATNVFLKAAPGSRHWLSVLYLPTWFTIHAQGVLWIKSRRLCGFSALNRPRAAIESGTTALFWISVGYHIGFQRSAFVIIIPMLLANTIIMAYISTNHLLRPLLPNGDVLTTSMSVFTWPLLDRLHFHFSHHVEHHLFPHLGSSYAPTVRSELVRIAADKYLMPGQCRALRAVFSTPRVYDSDRALVDPATGREVTFDQLDRLLRSESRRTITNLANRRSQGSGL